MHVEMSEAGGLVMRLIWLFIGAIVLVSVEQLVRKKPASSKRWRGPWVAEDPRVAMTISAAEWYAHVGNEGFQLIPLAADAAAGTANGDVRCFAGGQRVGSFNLRRSPKNVNRLELEILREGQRAWPPFVLARPS